MRFNTNIVTEISDPKLAHVGDVQATVEPKFRPRTESVVLDLRGLLSRGGCEHPATDAYTRSNACLTFADNSFRR
jgi:hypothetical protein